MDRFEAMRVFVRVVETGSFSAVARELGVGQPAVSKQIAALEARVGAPLVHRTTRSMSITQAGTEFYEAATRILEDLDTTFAQASGCANTPSGLVRATVAPVFGRLYIVPRLRELFRRHPKLSVELVVSDRPVNLVEQNIDVAIRNGHLADSSLIARTIGATPLVTVASAAYLSKHGEPSALDQLEGHSRIVFLGRGVPRAWRYSGGIVHHPEGRFRSNDAEQIRAAILDDLGLAQVPGWLVAPELASGAVRAVLHAYAPAPLPISAIRPGGRRLSAKVRVFIEFLLDGFAHEPMLGVATR